ncbi:hypothetical protein GCM10011571_16200 [Marinithermofilum abyssi]|uniref:MFS transporter n=1 Tax=Marinithermofilum abyssi TaxID=1571185 RepID=A0A8J2YAK3_9BACL|nr:hypothetical protein GCM10011571_16200 [Marinithermofilum abyssi]
MFGLTMIPLGLVLITFLLIAREAPDQPSAKQWQDYFHVLKQRDAWLFCFFYSITFGGFVGMASFLPIFFHDQYGLGKVATGDFVTLCVLAGSFFRPVGGWISDRVGGIRVLQVLYFLIASLFVVISLLLPFQYEIAVLFLVMSSLGLGNGAVFQLVPQRFREEIGMMTGIVGAAGGLGGFFLPSLLGVMKDTTGTYASGFIVLGVIVGAALVTMGVIGREWQTKLVVNRVRSTAEKEVLA